MDESDTKELPTTTMEQQILLCLEWLDLQTVVKTMNMKHNTYGYKHYVERWADTYISEDAFIEAVKIRNIPNQTVSFAKKSRILPLSEKTVRLYRPRIMCKRNGGTRIVEGIKRSEF